jgi:signal transduction histidine kinase
MSHEIRTPMTAILGFTDILRTRATLPEDVEATETIQRNGHYLLSLIDDILDLAKIEAGKLSVERIPCSPAAVAGEVSSLMRVPASAKSLPLRVEYAGFLPETIDCDPTRLRQILINLVGNAIKFTKVGEVRLIVKALDGGKLQFRVLDTGIGMTEEQMSRLFHPFTQADATTNRKFGGTGLGLTISKRLAELLGGQLSVCSTPGKGSEFTLTLNVRPLDEIAWIGNPAEAVQSHDRATPPLHAKLPLPCRLLIAEDGADNQRLLSFLLKKAGAGVILADDGQLAIARASPLTPSSWTCRCRSWTVTRPRRSSVARAIAV